MNRHALQAQKDLLERKVGRTLDTAAHQLAMIDAQLAKIEKRPQDVYEDGEVLFFNKQFTQNNGEDGIKYTYLAFKAHGKWYISGTRHDGYARTWDAVIDFMEYHEAEGITIEVWRVGSWQAEFNLEV